MAKLSDIGKFMEMKIVELRFKVYNSSVFVILEEVANLSPGLKRSRIGLENGL